MVLFSYLVVNDFYIYNLHRCKDLASKRMKMNSMSITPLHQVLDLLVSLASVSYSSGKKIPAFSFGYVYLWTLL